MTLRGFWKGIPIRPFLEGKTIEEPRFSPDGTYLSYIKKDERGRFLHLYDLTDQATWQLTYDKPLSTGTAYGGKTYCWTGNSQHIVFSHKGKLFRISTKGGEPQPVQSIDKSFAPTSRDDLLLFVVEQEERMALASSWIGDEISWPQQLPLTRSFIYDPDIHPSKMLLAVHAWDYPNMSWDGSEIVILDGTAGDDWKVQSVAGSTEIATCQPRFSPDGKHLSFLSEKTGWLNLWISDVSGENPQPLVDEPLEHSYTTWITGESNQVWLDSDRIAFTRNDRGKFSLAVVDITTGVITNLPLGSGFFSKLHADHEGRLVYLFENHQTRPRLEMVKVDEESKILSRSYIATSGVLVDGYDSLLIDPRIIDVGGTISQISGLYYCLGDKETKPPGVIIVHGGPTGMFYDKWQPTAQFLVSKGWAVFGINHRGSIGHGKDFRQSLMGNWGIYDVEDCIQAVEFLDQKGYLDKRRVAIMGGSAGGFTTLMTLAKYPGVFKAGINLFGVSDLFLLAEDTHYLEAHYTDKLVGPLPQEADKYIKQSPTTLADKITDPLLMFQGEEDPVVPKNQSMIIKEKVSGEVELHLYPQEGHGFKKTANLLDMYEKINRFLTKHVLYS